MNDLSENGSFTKASKYDSTNTIMFNLFKILERLRFKHEFYINAENVVDRKHWGDMLTLLEKFFANDPDWMTLLKTKAVQITGDIDMFDVNNPIRATSWPLASEDIENWVHSMWTMRSTEREATLMQRMSRLLQEEIPGYTDTN